MPTYVYRGLETGETFEIQQRITEDALTHSPHTGEPVVRVIQAAGIVFKGSGFYKTDSRKSTGSSTSGAAKTDTAKAESSGSSDSGSTSESATKTEPAKPTPSPSSTD